MRNTCKTAIFAGAARRSALAGVPFVAEGAGRAGDDVPLLAVLVELEGHRVRSRRRLSVRAEVADDPVCAARGSRPWYASLGHLASDSRRRPALNGLDPRAAG